MKIIDKGTVRVGAPLENAIFRGKYIRIWRFVFGIVKLRVLSAQLEEGEK